MINKLHCSSGCIHYALLSTAADSMKLASSKRHVVQYALQSEGYLLSSRNTTIYVIKNTSV
jgi:hypothetical protein